MFRNLNGISIFVNLHWAARAASDEAGKVALSKEPPPRFFLTTSFALWFRLFWHFRFRWSALNSSWQLHKLESISSWSAHLSRRSFLSFFFILLQRVRETRNIVFGEIFKCEHRTYTENLTSYSFITFTIHRCIFDRALFVQDCFLKSRSCPFFNCCELVKHPPRIVLY